MFSEEFDYVKSFMGTKSRAFNKASFNIWL